MYSQPWKDAHKAELLQRLLAERILVLDGAMGTMIQAHELQEADFRGERFADWPQDLQGNNDLLSITRPDVVSDIHNQYLAVGADILETNTFNANRVSLADYAMEELGYEINLASARLARAAADAATSQDRQRFVAGVLGPTNRTCSLSPDVNDPGYRNIQFDDLVQAYTEASRGLVEGGVDIILIETIFDTLNAKAAAFAVQTYFADSGNTRPVMISGTITDDAWMYQDSSGGPYWFVSEGTSFAGYELRHGTASLASGAQAQGFADLSDWYADDLSMAAGLPRLYLERDPSVTVTFPDTQVASSADVSFGARNAGRGGRAPSTRTVTPRHRQSSRAQRCMIQPVACSPNRVCSRPATTAHRPAIATSLIGPSEAAIALPTAPLPRLPLPISERSLPAPRSRRVHTVSALWATVMVSAPLPVLTSS